MKSKLGKPAIVVLTIIMVLMFATTSFAMATPIKSSYPKKVQGVLKVWNENQVDGYGCVYDNDKKIVMYYNTSYTLVNGLRSSNSGVRSLAITQLSKWSQVVDTAQWALGKDATAAFAFGDEKGNMMLWYTTATGWQSN